MLDAGHSALVSFALWLLAKHASPAVGQWNIDVPLSFAAGQHIIVQAVPLSKAFGALAASLQQAVLER
jgi:hypothetical protein